VHYLHPACLLVCIALIALLIVTRVTSNHLQNVTFSCTSVYSVFTNIWRFTITFCCVSSWCSQLFSSVKMHRFAQLLILVVYKLISMYAVSLFLKLSLLTYLDVQVSVYFWLRKWDQPVHVVLAVTYLLLCIMPADLSCCLCFNCCQHPFSLSYIWLHVAAFQLKCFVQCWSFVSMSRLSCCPQGFCDS